MAPPLAMDPAAAAAAAGPWLEVAPILAAAMVASTEQIKLGLAALTSMLLLGGAPFLQNYVQVWCGVAPTFIVFLRLQSASPPMLLHT